MTAYAISKSEAQFWQNMGIVLQSINHTNSHGIESNGYTWLRYENIYIPPKCLSHCIAVPFYYPLELEPAGIQSIDRIHRRVCKEVRIPTPKINRILSCPSPHFRIIIPRPESHKSGVLVPDTTGKPKRLQSRITVEQNLPKRPIVDPLGNSTGSNINNQPHTAQMIGDEAVDGLCFSHRVNHHHPRWRMALLGIDKTVRQVTIAIELGHWAQLVAVNPGLLDDAVDLLAHTAISAVDQILDLGTIR
jgi:hypothetical protein